MAAFSRLDSRALQAEPVAPSAAGPWAGMMAASLGIEVVRLVDFHQKMALHGIAIEPSRFFFDSFYAYKRLALAHATNDDPLKALTLEMFERYQALEKRRRDVSAFSRPH